MSDTVHRKPAALQPLPNFSETERVAQAKALMRLFDLWDLTDQERTRLLGGRDGAEATINHYRHGAPLDNAPDVLERAANLLAIHANLVRLYPENLQLAFSWVTTPNTAFEGCTPLDVMCNEGVTGIKRIRYHLDDALLD